MRNYKAIKEGDRYTIGEWGEGYNAFIINDGIYGYYWWETKEAAQKAADAYNNYEGLEWLGEHGAGSDVIAHDEIAETEPEMVELYDLFHAVEWEEE